MKVQHTAQIDQSALVSLVNSSISWAQLERGQLDVAFQVVQVPPFVISSRSLNLACQVTAKPKQATTAVGIIESLRPGARWFGQEVTNDDIALGRDELDIRFGGASTVLAIAVDERQLESRLTDSPDAADLIDGLRRDRISRNPIAAMRLRSIIRSVCSWRAAPQQSVTGTLIPLLAETLRTFDHYSITPSNRRSRPDGDSRRFVRAKPKSGKISTKQ